MGRSCLSQLINEYGEDRVISAEMIYNPFWWLEPKRPSWRFVQILVKPWEQPDVDELAQR